MNYRETLNLPKTDFPMRADLAQREPARVAWWTEKDVYARMVAANADGAPYHFHDGPPYANGRLHHGHILNKVLKDIVLKVKSLSGFHTTFVPGWDCHGLPIEIAAEKELGKGKARSLGALELRKACRDYADKFVDIQRKEFMRLGVLGDWFRPYLTTQRHYEATIVRELGKLYGTGSVYRGKKPVQWCAACKTALAEAEVEYEDHTSPSIWVRFELEQNTSVVIWTTTPWTLPANLGVAFNPAFEYSWLSYGDETLIVASELVERFAQETGRGGYTVTRKERGAWFERKPLRHPFLDRASLGVLGDHVTLEAGTGCVHTAPGHGADDALVGARYGLPMYAPVDDDGRYTDEFPLMVGRSVFDCNEDVIQLLVDRGALVHRATIKHTYPHCWRSKNPIIFRATDQWFVAMDDDKRVRERVLDAIAKVQWIPEWSEQRITGMVRTRPDWCISRQRRWGVPLTFLFCDGCGGVVASEAMLMHVADLVEEHGSDVWYTREARDLVPAGTACGACGGTSFTKEMDIVDVWFESGVSWAAVMTPEIGVDGQVDLYLEGSDQHRGWFQSSLLGAVPTRDRSPFKRCLTHGFVVDGQGKKLSKSLGNYIPPEEMLKEHGAEILRLWVCSSDYREDIRISKEILKTLSEAYRKIRNTLRFLVSNLYDFDPNTDVVPEPSRHVLDRHALAVHRRRMAAIVEGYETFAFHQIYHQAVNYTNVDLSAFYMDVAKDRLYCEAAAGPIRRSAQSTLYEILRDLVISLSPVLSFTCEEMWEHMPRRAGDPDSVFLAHLDAVAPASDDPALEAALQPLLDARAAMLPELEKLRAEKAIGTGLDAAVVLGATPALAGKETLLQEVFIVSQVTLAPGQGVLSVGASPHKKCARCWKHEPEIGDDGGICDRCRGVLGAAS